MILGIPSLRLLFERLWPLPLSSAGRFTPTGLPAALQVGVGEKVCVASFAADRRTTVHSLAWFGMKLRARQLRRPHAAEDVSKIAAPCRVSRFM